MSDFGSGGFGSGGFSGLSAGSEPAELRDYAFLGAGGSATVSGIFVGWHGFMTGTSFTGTVPVANGSNDPKRFADLYGASLPDDAVGFVGVISGNSVYVGLDVDDVADLKTNYARYPQAPPTSMAVMGDVASSTVAGNSSGSTGTGGVSYSLGRREATTLATATTQKVFASVVTAAPLQRQLVSIENCDSSADIYVYMVSAGASPPTISSTNHDFIVSPKSNRSFPLGVGIDLYVRSSGSGTINYTAVELL